MGFQRVPKAILRCDGRGCQRDTSVKKCVHADDLILKNQP